MPGAWRLPFVPEDFSVPKATRTGAFILNGTHDNLIGRRIRIDASAGLEPWTVRVYDVETGEEIINVTRIEIDLSVHHRENRARLHLYVADTSPYKNGHTERVDVTGIECEVQAKVEYA